MSSSSKRMRMVKQYMLKLLQLVEHLTFLSLKLPLQLGVDSDYRSYQSRWILLQASTFALSLIERASTRISGKRRGRQENEATQVSIEGRLLFDEIVVFCRVKQYHQKLFYLRTVTLLLLKGCRDSLCCPYRPFVCTINPCSSSNLGEPKRRKIEQQHWNYQN